MRRTAGACGAAAAAAAALLCAGGLAGRARAAGAHPGVDLQQQLAQNIPESAEIAESAPPGPAPRRAPRARPPPPAAGGLRRARPLRGADPPSPLHKVL